MSTITTAQVASTAEQETPHASKSWLQRSLPLWLLLPAFAFLVLIQVVPTIYSIYLSFTRVRAGQFSFVGLANYQRLLASSDFYEALWRTVIFAGSYLVLTIGLGLGLALLLNQNIRFRGLYVTLIFVPWVLSDVVSGTMWRWMFQQSYGIVQTALNPLVNGTSLLANNTGAMAIVILASVWRTLAFTALLFLGALQIVPREVLESAALDGGSRWRTFWAITFPLIRPTLLVAILITSIRGINSLGLILATTSGGPGGGTTTAAVLLYQEAWKFGDFGMAAAMAVMLFALNLLLTILYLRTLRAES